MFDLNNLSLEQKIGQILAVSFDGDVLTNEEIERFKKHYFSNFIYFARNLKDYKSVANLSKHLHDISMENCGMPAFLTIDQEGGMVTRLYSGATLFPSNMAITASGVENAAYLEGKMVAKELLALGINFNLAPNMDVNNNPLNPVIGVRSYSNDSSVVAKMGCDYIMGSQENGVVATTKHFPGHGDTAVDSHLGLPVVSHDEKRLSEVELLPFKAAIAAGVDCVMSSHIVFPSLDESGLPATLSYKILTELLREKLGFTGLIMTDAMDMKAIADHYGIELGTIMAINAGADIICLCNNNPAQASSFNAVLQAVKDGEIPMSRIDDAVSRIIELKKKYIPNMQPYAPANLVESYSEHISLSKEISLKSITLLRDNDNLLPIDVDSEKTLVISPPPIRANLADNSIIHLKSMAEYLGETLSCDYREIDINPDEAHIAELSSIVASYDNIVVGTYNGILNKGQITLVKSLYERNKNIIVIPLRIPYDANELKEVGTILLAYEYTNNSNESVAEVLLGKFKPVGRCPVTLDE